MAAARGYGLLIQTPRSAGCHSGGRSGVSSNLAEDQHYEGEEGGQLRLQHGICLIGARTSNSSAAARVDLPHLEPFFRSPHQTNPPKTSANKDRGWGLARESGYSANFEANTPPEQILETAWRFRRILLGVAHIWAISARSRLAFPRLVLSAADESFRRPKFKPKLSDRISGLDRFVGSALGGFPTTGARIVELSDWVQAHWGTLWTALSAKWAFLCF